MGVNYSAARHTELHVLGSVMTQKVQYWFAAAIIVALLIWLTAIGWTKPNTAR
jgi:hypothetical protein